ncbi:MAG: hypothetical protein U0414_18025 [Polyangiaceae bacterium]
MSPEAALSPSSIRALERHHFPAIEVLRYRNADLDVSSVRALLASLDARPPHAFMRRTDDAEDHRALRALLARDDVRVRAESRRDAALLWQVAQIPDYRKLLFEDHVETLARLFAELDDAGGVVDRNGIEEELDRIAKPVASPGADVGVEELLARLARVRTWNYVANAGWVDPASGVRERAIEVEDTLSDKLQIALRDRRSARLATRASPWRAGTIHSRRSRRPGRRPRRRGRSSSASRSRRTRTCRSRRTRRSASRTTSSRRPRGPRAPRAPGLPRRAGDPVGAPARGAAAARVHAGRSP